ncbi:MAG: HD domain-containing protein, partial [Firmicutes bacterium]|nr:HD domain-containing protein [Bacillota bacterium]
MRLVAIEDLKPGLILGKTVVGNQGQILLRQGVKLTAGYIQYLENYSFTAVYISSGRGVVVEDVVSDETRLRALRETRRVLAKVKRGAPLEVGEINKVLVAVIDELLLQDDVMVNLVDLRSFDEELFGHSVNVAILAVLAGMENNFQKEKLKDLAQAALLHDLGYLFTAEKNSAEHVHLGLDFLRKSGLKASVLEPIFQHHERWDGNG